MGEFERLVPRDVDGNLGFRLDLARRYARDKGLQRELWKMCSRDPLFWVNTFCWTYDPRKTPNQVPMVTWPFQDEAIEDLLAAIRDGEDRAIEKSRDTGASWCCCIAFMHRFLFGNMEAFLMASRKEELVDKRGDSSTLFWKLDYMLEQFPSWMRPPVERTAMHMMNIENGCTIDGESTNKNLGRGKRLTSILLDEFAAVEEGYAVYRAVMAATDCVLYNSTPMGVGNAFYDVIQNPAVKKLRFHWSQQPPKAKGLYRGADGKVEVLDKGYAYPEKYPFILDGKLRSPWYDHECARSIHPMAIAQELDIDYLGSDSTFFDQGELDRYVNEFSRPPYMEGELRFNAESALNPSWKAQEGGRLKLWTYFDGGDSPPDDRDYIVAADVAAGTGSSNSIIVVGDRMTSEKVAEFACNRTGPHELAKYAVALCRFFRGKSSVGAHLIWEANGVGRIFGNTVVDDLKYLNIHYRQNEEKVGGGKATMLPGWFSTPGSKTQLLGEYKAGIMEWKFVNRSVAALRECKEYVYRLGGKIEHVKSANKEDASASGDQHGDRVIADALCWHAMRFFGSKRKVESAPVAEPGSFLWRRQMRERDSRKAACW